MKYKFAIPENKIFKDLYSNAKDDIEIILLDEKKCIELISTNRVNAAFLSPLGYSKGVTLTDYRIVPGPVIALKNYTGFSSIYFRNDLKSIVNSFADNPDDFIITASKILLSEKYDININPKLFTNDIDRQIIESDIIISSRESKEQKPILDVSEDWFDSFEIPLILGIWVINSHLEEVDFLELVNSIVKPGLLAEEIIIENVPELEPREPRKGSIVRKWNEEIEIAIEETIKLLYYHQYIKEIAAVKLFGRD